MDTATGWGIETATGIVQIIVTTHDTQNTLMLTVYSTLL